MDTVLVASKSCGIGLGREGLEAYFKQHGLHPVFDPLASALPHLEDFDAMVVGIDPIGEEQMKAGPRLRVVMKFGVGKDNIDQDAADRRNIQVLNMPGINSEAVAELAFALMMGATRRISEADRKVRAGEWPRLVAQSPIGKTLGLIGTGNISRMMLKLCAGLEMKVIGYDPFPNPEFEALGGGYVALEELLRQADYVSIHCPLTEDTHHMINATSFAQMKDSAILINTARGPIVDEYALYQALKAGKLAAAALDVFENEPLGDSPLLELDNCICLPHIAAYTHETLIKMDKTCVENLASALKK